jgi:hypothetical protein
MYRNVKMADAVEDTHRGAVLPGYPGYTEELVPHQTETAPNIREGAADVKCGECLQGAEWRPFPRRGYELANNADKAGEQHAIPVCEVVFEVLF